MDVQEVLVEGCKQEEVFVKYDSQRSWENVLLILSLGKLGFQPEVFKSLNKELINWKIIFNPFFD